jgi:hypothetical protein
MPTSAYGRGIDAAHRIGEYEGVQSTPDCPYPEGSPEHKEWWHGFGDGTEDRIAAQRAGEL